MQIRFTKMHGLGNDFVVIDLLSQNAELSALQIRQLADRHRGIGCDQLLLVEAPKSPETDFHYRIFNADGEEVEQCGNGARCFGKFVSDKRLTGKNTIRVSTMTGELTIEIIDASTVCVDMGVPNLSPESLPFIADQAPCLNQNSFLVAHALGESELNLVSMGNPHAIVFVDDVDALDLATVRSAPFILPLHTEAHKPLAFSLTSSVCLQSLSCCCSGRPSLRGRRRLPRQDEYRIRAGPLTYTP